MEGEKQIVGRGRERRVLGRRERRQKALTLRSVSQSCEQALEEAFQLQPGRGRGIPLLGMEGVRLWGNMVDTGGGTSCVPDDRRRSSGDGGKYLYCPLLTPPSSCHILSSITHS
ncbi:hypothetical protein FKM82_030836 [Ascaphus truei]